MPEDFKTYLDEMKFEKYFNSLKKKIKNKKVIIYGSGSMFRYIKEHYDIDSLNIIGISDIKYTVEAEGGIDCGYKIITKNNIVNYSPDYVLVAAQNYTRIVENLVLHVFKDAKIKVYPLVRVPIFKLVKEIWKR